MCYLGYSSHVLLARLRLSCVQAHCVLVPYFMDPLSVSFLRARASFVVHMDSLFYVLFARLRLLHGPALTPSSSSTWIPFFYIFFARLHLLRGPAHPIFTPDFMDSLSSSSSPRSSSIQCRRIPYTKFLMTLPLLSSFSFFSPVLFGARMLIHACCRLPLPLQGLRLVRWILQNSIVLALFYLPISHGSSSRVFLVSF